MEKNKDFPEKLLPVLNAAWADLRINNKIIPKQLNYLQQAIDGTSRKATKIRYNYILAQLHEKIGDKSNALRYYDKVINLTLLILHLQSQMAKAFSYDSIGQKGNIRKTLEKH